MFHSFVDNMGRTIVRASHGFTKGAQRAFRNWSRGAATYHVRVGRFSCVYTLSGKFAAAEMYEDDAFSDVTRDSAQWDAHRRDRLDSLDQVALRVLTTHPMFNAIERAIKRERKELR
jgi:hypothetical protein